jgi:hypothetical protein
VPPRAPAQRLVPTSTRRIRKPQVTGIRCSSVCCATTPFARDISTGNLSGQRMPFRRTCWAYELRHSHGLDGVPSGLLSCRARTPSPPTGVRLRRRCRPASLSRAMIREQGPPDLGHGRRQTVAADECRQRPVVGGQASQVIPSRPDDVASQGPQRAPAPTMVPTGRLLCADQASGYRTRTRCAVTVVKCFRGSGTKQAGSALVTAM